MLNKINEGVGQRLFDTISPFLMYGILGIAIFTIIRELLNKKYHLIIVQLVVYALLLAVCNDPNSFIDLSGSFIDSLLSILQEV